MRLRGLAAIVVVAGTAVAGASVAAQTTGGPSAGAQRGDGPGAAAKAGAGGSGPAMVSLDPVQCWWRTSTGAVRVGQTFSVLLTCGVIETDAATVVVDQSKLEPSVVQFPPFEVIGGTHGADLRTDQRRFFQYEYRLRLIAENLFGKDVGLPETKISYRIQTHVAQKTSLEGRDQTYILPAQSIRLLSLVPADAADIRDATGETFTDVDQRAFRANLFVVVGGVLFALAALVALLALVRMASRYRKTRTATDHLIADGRILRAVGSELAEVQRQREASGWSSDLAGRALAAMRVAGTYALGRTASQTRTANGAEADQGQLILSAGWPRSQRIAVSGSATAQMVSSEIARPSTNGRGRGPERAFSGASGQLLEPLHQALSDLTSAQYGQNGKFDETALDQALTNGTDIVRRLKWQQSWVMKRLAGRKAHTETASRTWSR
ncbi:MAG TPA: hypothetical protein VNZ26_22470 [Vicinamibacterales bacterium]|jgi:hypothetical protein|nr:hypothetical protein [Vicinamibacterales bacterium]